MMGEFSRVYKTELSDVQLGSVWERFVECDRDQHIFYNKPPMDGKDFARFCRDDDVHLWVILFRDEIAGIFWLTGHEGKTAYCHFGQLPTKAKRTAEKIPVQLGFGRYCLGTALWAHDGQDFLLDRLLGLTPLCNRSAVRFIDRLGAQPAGIIPGACFFNESGKNEDGIATYYTRETVPMEWCKV